jgi:hypothetical protein
LVLTNVPGPLDPPELVPLPVVLTGALVLTNGDPAVPVVPVVPVVPLSVPPEGAGLAAADAALVELLVDAFVLPR